MNSVKRSLLGLLPDSLRLGLIRRSIPVPPDWPSPSFEIKIAQTEEELKDGFRVLHDAYVGAGLMNAHPTRMRVLRQHMLPQTTTVIAKWDGQVIGTLSLIRDNFLGLPLEKIFDVGARRRGERQIAEISSLAIDPKFRNNKSQLTLSLIRFVYQCARYYFGLHEVVIAVNPSSVAFYQGLLCFEKLENTIKSYPFVKGARAVGLYLDFATCTQRWNSIFGHRPEPSNFANYWNHVSAAPQNRLPVRGEQPSKDFTISPEILEKLFIKKAHLWKKFDLADIENLKSIYPSSEYRRIFENLQSRCVLAFQNSFSPEFA